MLTAAQFDQLSTPITDLYEQYIQSVINDIARRLVKLKLTDAGAWQMQRLVESGAVYENAIKELAKVTGASEAALRKAFQRAGVTSLRFDDAIYTAAGLKPLPLNLSPAMANVLAAGLQKTGGLIRNLTMTTALSGQQAFVKAADLAYMQVSSGAFDYNTAIRNAVKQVAASGLTSIDYAGHTDQLDVAMRRAVLTGVSQTAGRLQMTRADEMGTDLVAVSAHTGARNRGVGPMNHESWQGKVYSRSGAHSKYPNFYTVTGYGTGEGLGGWNCVIGDTEVSGPPALIGYKRKYSGELITLRTAGGKELSVTHNHPILTPEGWVAAGLLTEGDYVICRRVGNGTSVISPNYNEHPSRIEDVFSSLGENGKSVVFFGSPKDFHGDGSNSEINVVFSNRFLRDGADVLSGEQFIQYGLGVPSYFPGALVSKCALPEIGVSSLHTANSVVSGLNKSGAVFRFHSGQSDRQSLGARGGNGYSDFCQSFPDSAFRTSEIRSNRGFSHAGPVQTEDFINVNLDLPVTLSLRDGQLGEPKACKPVTDYLVTASEMTCEGALTFSLFEETDEIVFIKRELVASAHVYNLHTIGEWYYANGIITHNCRHSFYPFFEGISQNVYDQATQGYEDARRVFHAGRQFSVYEATQIQRAIERRIRDWKRQRDALEAAGLENAPEAAKVAQWQSRARDFVRQTGLGRQYAREQ